MYIYSRSAYFVYHILNNFAAQQKKPDFFPPTFLWIIPISLDVVNPPKYKESIFKMKIDNVSVTNSFSNLEWLNFQIEKKLPKFHNAQKYLAGIDVKCFLVRDTQS